MRKPIPSSDRDCWIPIAVLLSWGLFGCAQTKDDGTTGGAGTAGNASEGVNDSGDASDTGPQADACIADLTLELVPLDIWGRDLPTANFDTDVGSLTPDSETGPGVRWVAIDDPDTILNISLSAPDHNSSTVQLRHQGSGVFSVTGNTGSALIATSRETRSIDAASCDVVTLYIGLDHTWFAATGYPPDNNTATFMFSPDLFWGTVQKDLLQANQTVHWSTWWWESDMELTRPMGHASMVKHERRVNTSMYLLNALSGTKRRLLINRFWDDNLDWTTTLTTDEDLLNRATHLSDDFEVIVQGNGVEVPVTGTYDVAPTPIDFGHRVLSNPRYADADLDTEDISPVVRLELQVASWHQKSVIIDSEVAFIGGMNTKNVDWDTKDHLLFDWRRMAFDASLDERAAVVERTQQPDNIPRRDYGIRIEGPAAWDADAVFQSRWRQGRAQGDAYAEYTDDLSLPSRPEPIESGVPAQVVTTMPEPWNEQSIVESHNKAFSNATEYIFIEDQYFRAPMVEESIIQRMNEEPDLVLIVVSMPVYWWDGGAKWSYFADSTFKALFPDRYALFQMRTVDLVTEEGLVWDDVLFYSMDIMVHSKLRIIDDRFLSVGSCNMNNRGYKYDGELNVNVLDEDFATLTRMQVLDNLVGDYWAPYLSDDPVNNLDVMRLAAEDNQYLNEWWTDNAEYLSADEAEEYWIEYRPSGFLYPLEFPSDWDLDVGPDLF